MCTAIRIVVLAGTQERRAALRRAAVGVAWQVVAAVGSTDEAIARLTALRGRVLVIDAGVKEPGTDAVVTRLRGAVPDVLLVGVGHVPGTDAEVPTDDLSRLPDVLADLLHRRGDHSH